uniref:Uncharacterized protein n=1 Tax=Tetradesmus obliquus TaxID=3088 RepID=A0A383VHZ0_TETOB
MVLRWRRRDFPAFSCKPPGQCSAYSACRPSCSSTTPAAAEALQPFDGLKVHCSKAEGASLPVAGCAALMHAAPQHCQRQQQQQQQQLKQAMWQCRGLCSEHICLPGNAHACTATAAPAAAPAAAAAAAGNAATHGGMYDVSLWTHHRPEVLEAWTVVQPSTPGLTISP